MDDVARQIASSDVLEERTQILPLARPDAIRTRTHARILGAGAHLDDAVPEHCLQVLAHAGLIDKEQEAAAVSSLLHHGGRSFPRRSVDPAIRTPLFTIVSFQCGL